MQKILFQTAFKCRDDLTGENRIAESMVPDDSLSFAENPDSAASGFSFAARDGGFSFSHDAHLLPSAFDAGELILPEAKRPPFMNFVQSGWRAEWRSPAT